jgi:purine-binding chemotaxis protein CheW
MGPENHQFVVFSLDGSLYGLRLRSVEKVIPAAMITPLPDAPTIVLGVVRIGVRVVPVIGLRRRFHLTERDLLLTDKFIIAQTPRRGGAEKLTVALVVDSVEGVREIPADAITPAPRVVAGLGYLEGIATTQDGMVLIQDLETLLSLDEEDALGAALRGATP